MGGPAIRPPCLTRLAAMPGWFSKPLLAGVVALAFAGCGGGGAEKTIPPDAADQMLSTLAAAEEAIARGDCGLATEYAGDLVAEVNALPAEVGTEAKEGLRAAAERVGELAASEQCEPVDTTTEQDTQEDEPTTEQATTTTTTEETTETTETDETTDTDETTTTDETETTTTSPEAEPDDVVPEPGGGAGGIGGGSGSGGIGGGREQG